MKKICIITLMGNYNFGNRLQNLALQITLEKMGTEVITLDNTTIDYKVKQWVKNLYAACYQKQNFFKKSNSNLLLREYNFYKFTKHFIKIKKVKSIDKYICIVGSDQVWAPAMVQENPILLLNDVKCLKKYSYAASFGIKNIPSEMQNVYNKCLKKFDGLSVREDAGVAIIKHLGIKEVRKVLDPTLLLTKKEWDNYAKRIVELEEKKYIVIYFLGEIHKDLYRQIKQMASEQLAEVIDLMDNTSKKWYTKDPGEFLFLIKNAFCVFTDSFHGTIFSYIYKRPFFVYSRNSKINMNSRIETLLDSLGVQGRMNLKCDEKNIYMQWPPEEQFMNLKKESEKYLAGCLSDK